MLWLFTCLAVLTGCSSTYHPIAVTEAGLPAEAESGKPRIAVGTKVRITIICGETTTGEVSRITAEGLVLGEQLVGQVFPPGEVGCPRPANRPDKTAGPWRQPRARDSRRDAAPTSPR